MPVERPALLAYPLMFRGWEQFPRGCSIPMSDLAPSRSVEDPSPRGWIAWAGLGLVAILAGTAVLVSVELRTHADDRRLVMEELAQLETLAVTQSSTVWQALTLMMADERMRFGRLRGTEQMQRQEILAELDHVRALDEKNSALNSSLGFEPSPELWDDLDSAVHGFLGSVQGALGQMSMNAERLRERLRYWDMSFGPVVDALAALEERDGAIAVASSKLANRATIVAALVTLLAAALLVLRLSHVRSNRRRELQQERMRTLAASEARFRELVQNSSDMILVLEPNGIVRYATPSARALAGLADDEKEAKVDQVLGQSVADLLSKGDSEVSVLHHGGEQRVMDVHATDLSDHPDIEGIVLNARDITERKTLEERLRHQAHHDPLTNLPNRREFKRRYDGTPLDQRADSAVLFVDLDGFKLVNDSFGHKSGDELLIATACRIGSCLQKDDLLARQGGDEFLILIAGDPGQTAKKIQDVLAPPFVLQDREVFVSASIGIAAQAGALDSDQVVQRADIAMYAAKKAGKARAIAFADEMLGDATERIALEADFRRGLERDEFKVVYQPKVGLESGVTESLEALVRWIHPTRGFVGPDLFIPFAEESGLVSELGRLVLEKACMDAVRWQESGVVVAVNLSPVQFRNPNLIAEIQGALDMSGLDPRYLELEITESAVLGDVATTVQLMSEMKELGVRLAIDDFGTGYSNISHLKHFDVDVLKIDQCFVRGAGQGDMDHLSDGEIVKAVIGMAKAFGLHVVAEGVESQSHATQLRELGADLGQGYFFSKPVSGDEIDTILAGEHTRRAA